jgi:ABC-type phosphate/phosphonate transport system substrate-binding protein
MNELMLVAFLFLKTGEKFATQEAAGQTVAGFTSYLAAQVGGVQFAPAVLNDPQQAVEFVAAKQPGVGIVTPGFFLAHGKELGMSPLLETKRAGVSVEKYVLVTRAKPVTTIATTLAAEARYVTRVVLQNKFAIQLKPVTNIESALFDLAEGKGGADAVLVEMESWKLFAGDPDLAKVLKVEYESPELPGALVVTFAGWKDADRLKQTLTKMGTTEEGKKVLASIRVETFAEVNRDRLNQAEKLFHGQ